MVLKYCKKLKKWKKVTCFYAYTRKSEYVNSIEVDMPEMMKGQMAEMAHPGLTLVIQSRLVSPSSAWSSCTINVSTGNYHL